ncbi:response regulator transcription factor [Flaviflexus massiliensis]|uniref:response regulator transcription factor n=1 Tax=Flaviflexus massiliensis TaxID=1522309 RepID=UPI00097D84C9|nr:response regulator transcription factor [Flaviflexus massiliensis]
MTKPVALIVDDEKQMTSIVSFALEVQGFDFHTAHNVADAWRILNTYSIDIVVLDVMMPSGSGIDLTHRIRTLSSSIPIILLTALGAEKDRIAGLEAGADDYVTKPFSPRELALRAQAIVRRSNSRANQDFVEYGSLLIDRTRLSATWKGRHLDLSDTEVRLLLALSGGDIVSQREILNKAWATTETVGGREMVKTTIYRLRRQLANLKVEGLEIESHRGLGYSLNVEE